MDIKRLCPSLVFAVALAGSVAAGAQTPSGRTASAVSSANVTSRGIAAPHNPRWVKMPLLTPEQKKAGVIPGGEGAQWPRGPVAASPADPDFLLLPIDVGGVYRSLDGGKTWDIAMVGWNARGANGFAIDPKNADRALGIAANSMNWNEGWGKSPHGLYLTTDKAASWKQVFPTVEGFDGRVAFDPTSFDAAKGYCTRAYYLSSDHGLFHSDDGGETWAAIAGSPDPGHHKGADWSEGVLTAPGMEIDPTTGAVYLGGSNGLFRTTDRGRTWEHPRTQAVYSLAVAPGGTLYVGGPDGLLVSSDGGKTFAPKTADGLDISGNKHIQSLTISHADPKRLLCWTSGSGFNWPRYVSQNGGDSWTRIKVLKSGAPLPMNGRQGYMTWNAKDPDIAYGLGGDWVTRSVDGGRTFEWANNGYNGIMTGGLFNFSQTDPNTVYLGFQDYNGAFTTDGGATWNYRDVSGKGWGGHEYGAFAAAGGRVMWSGDAEGWGNPRRLRLSRDGGAIWQFVNGPDGKPLEFKGSDVSYQDPFAPTVLFASDLRSADGGATWARMPDCDGVFTASAGTKALYGRKGNAVVRSSDHGATWSKVAEVPGGFGDLAIDTKTGRIYVASEDRLKFWEKGAWSNIETPKDQYDHARVWTVAVDPVDPRVIYVGGPMNTYAGNATICRSTDAGKTWQNLTVTSPLQPGESGGPHEVSCIRVHPKTRDAWVAGQCFGLWRIAAPLQK